MKYLFVFALLLITCSACQNDEVIVLDEGLRLSESLDINGSMLSFHSVEQDSRCPLPANCVWAGIGIVRLEMENGDLLRLGTVEGSEANPPNAVDYNGSIIRLERLDPYPVDGEEIALEDYRLFLTLE